MTIDQLYDSLTKLRLQDKGAFTISIVIYDGPNKATIHAPLREFSLEHESDKVLELTNKFLDE